MPSEPVIRLIRNSCTFTRRSRRVRLLSFAALALLVISVGAALLAVQQGRNAQSAAVLARKQGEIADAKTREAQEQSRVAAAQRLAAQSGQLLNQQPKLLKLSVLLAMQSLRFDLPAPTPEGYQALTLGLGILPRLTEERRQAGPVRLLAVSPDGRYLAVSGDQGPVRMWDRSRSELLISVNYRPGRSVAAIAVSPNGRFLAVGWGGTVDMWPVGRGRRAPETPQRPLAIPAPVRQPRGATFSADGKLFGVIGYGGSMVRVWNVSDWSATQFNTSGAVAIGFSPDGQYLFAAGRGSLETFELSGTRRGPISTPIPQTDLAGFSSDGKCVATAGDDQIARIWSADRSSGRWRQTLQVSHQGRITAVAASPDSSMIAVASEDGTARTWSAGNRLEHARMTHDRVVTAVSFAAGGRILASASEDGTVRLWETSGERIVARRQFLWELRGVSRSPDGGTFATIGSDGRVRVWSPDNGAEVEAPPMAAQMSDGELPYELVHSAFSPNGLYAAVVVSSGEATVWDTTSGRASDLYVSEDSTAIAISPDGKFLALAYQPGSVFVRRNDPAETIVWRVRNVDAPSVLEFSPNGDWLAIGDREGRVRLAESRTGRVTAEFRCSRAVEALRFTSGGGDLAIADESAIAIWSWRNGPSQSRMTLRPEGTVRALDFSPDGSALAAGSVSGVVQVWDLRTGRMEARFVHEAAVEAVAFSGDGRRLLTGGLDQALQIAVWRIPDMMELGCRRLQRNLTAAEWRTYVGDQPFERVCRNLP